MPSAAYSLDKPLDRSQAMTEPRDGAVRRSADGRLRTEQDKRASERPQEEPTRTAEAAADLNEVVESLNGNLEVLRRDLRFSVDDDSGETVVKVLDAETEEVIRQIPAEEVLELQKRLEEAAGVIFRGQA
jgi:flagellar protein FlaG